MEELKPVFSVHELNEYVSLMLGQDPNLSHLCVEGEISGAKRHPNGHLYFTLKDENASVSCVMWRQYTQSLRFIPRDGMRVRLLGSAALYERDGRFQLYARALQKQGEGDLYTAFCRYRDSLKELGWFDESLKKKIPKLPRCVGVVTSSSGAAFQDICNVIRRRFPTMPIRLYPAAVQGATASSEIAAAIDRACAENLADVLIVGRGGGSMEDLWAFNEPPVAEAIYRCTIPVISAVGHETDFSISDFVADLRAPTPSAAAEIAVPERAAMEQKLGQIGKRLTLALSNGISRKKDRLRLLWADGIAPRIQMKTGNARQTIEETWHTAEQSRKESFNKARVRLEQAALHLEAYNPQKTLERGFVLLYGADRNLISLQKDLTVGENVIMRFKDGNAEAVITGKDDIDG